MIEGPRGRPVHGGRPTGPARPGCARYWTRWRSRRDATYKKVMNKLDVLTPPRVTPLCGVVVEVGAGARGRGVQGRPAGRGGGKRVRPARRVQLDPGQPVRRGTAGRWPPSTPAFSTVGAIAMQGCAAPSRSSARPPWSSASAWSASWWSGCSSRGLASGWVRLEMIEARCRLARTGGRCGLRGPDDEAWPPWRPRWTASPAAACRPRVPGRGRLL